MYSSEKERYISIRYDTIITYKYGVVQLVCVCIYEREKKVTVGARVRFYRWKGI